MSKTNHFHLAFFAIIILFSCTKVESNSAFSVNHERGNFETASDHVNDGWYSLTGGWTVNNGGEYDYNYHRTMTYGFSVTN